MDLGRLRRKRARYWVWLLAPVAIGTVMHVGTLLYARQAVMRLAQRRELAAALPTLERTLEQANACVARFPGLVNGASVARTALSARVTETAGRCAFVINSLRVGEPVPGGVVGALPAQVVGEGSLAAVLAFLDTLLQPELLLQIEAVSIKASRFVPAPIFSCEIELRAHYTVEES